MYTINTIPHVKCFVRYLHTSCFCIRNRTSERSERVRFLIQKQLVCKYRTPALSVKYSLYMFHRRYSNCQPQNSARYYRIICQRVENTSFLRRCHANCTRLPKVAKVTNFGFHVPFTDKIRQI